MGRGGALILALAFALAGCLGGGEDGALAPENDLVLNADGTEEAIAADVESLPVEDSPPLDGRLSGEEVELDAPPPAPVPEPEPEPEPDPNEAAEIAAARKACERQGGRFGAVRGTSTLLRCFTTPKDANTACRTGSDCQGACLARSRTCAPVIPLLGCHSIVLPNGVVAEQCRN